jgi:hypothetical protein
VTEPPPAELFRRLTPIPTFEGAPTTTPHDIEGVDPSGTPVHIAVLGSADPVLLLFLKADCLGCHDLWSGLDQLRASLPPAVGLAVLTRGPSEEDAVAIGVLGANSSGVPTVMGSAAFADYRVAGPPFLVVVDGERVRTEGVAWGLEETLRATLVALDA